MPRFSGSWFTIAFSISYVILLMLELPLFYYYPLTGQWSMRPLGQGQGPAMQWYGLMAGAGLAGLLAALAMNSRRLPAGAADWLFAIPLAAMALCLYLMRGFFG